MSHSSAVGVVEDRRREADRPDPGGTLDPQLGSAQEVGLGRDERPEVFECPAGLGEGEHRGRRAAAAPAIAGPQPARVLDDGLARLRCRARFRCQAGVRTQAPAPCRAGSPPKDDPFATDSPLGGLDSPSGSSAIGATVALARIAQRRRGRPGRPRSAVPAAAHTTRNRPRSGSMITRTGRLWPMGGMPPMTNPVSSLASRAVARRMPGSPVIAASRATSTRFGPETRQTIGSRRRPRPGRRRRAT